MKDKEVAELKDSIESFKVDTEISMSWNELRKTKRKLKEENHSLHKRINELEGKLLTIKEGQIIVDGKCRIFDREDFLRIASGLELKEQK